MDDIKIRLNLEGAEQVQSGATRAADGLKKLGDAGARAGQQTQLSGQQMAQVSAQLQDLFVQIQGGQAPLTAILQQGSQLSAVFGGVGNALRAVGSLVSPALAVFGSLAAAGIAVGLAYNQGAEEAKAYTRALVLSGNAAGVTAGQLQEMARAQGQVIGTQSDAAAALAKLAATGQVASLSLQSAAEAAVRFSRVGGDIDETVKKFAKLGGDPLKGLIALNEAENFLTESVYRQVKSLVEQGRAAEAAAVAQQSYASAVNGRAQQLEQSLGSIERGWQGVKDAAAAAWDAMLNVGRPDTTAALDRQLAQLERRQQILSAGNAQQKTEAIQISAQIAALKGQRDALAEVEREQRRGADSAAARKRQVDRLIKADEDAAKALKTVNAERDREAAAIERAMGLSGSYAKDLQELYQLRQRGKLTEEQYVAAVEKLIKVQPVVREQLEAQAAAFKLVADAEERGLDLHVKKLAALDQSADAVAKQVQKLRDEEAALQLSVTGNISLAQAIEQVNIARLREQQTVAAGDSAAVALIQREIDARKELAKLIDSKDNRAAAKRSADEAAKEWQRASDDIERSLTDALLRGFESGKGFASNLRDTLVNMFKTLVLRPIIQPIMAGISGTVGQFLGMPAQAGTSGGGPLGSMGSSASTLSSLFGLGGMGSAFSGGASLALSGAGGTGLALEGSAALLGNGAYAQGLAQGAGALAPWAAGAAVGIYGGRAISNGYALGGGSGNTAVNVGTAIGAVIGGPIGAAIGGAIGGLANRAFGRGPKESTDSGIMGTIGGGDFAGQAYNDWLKKGGWFRSDKRGTDYMSLDTELSAALDMGAGAILSNTKEWAQALQLPAEQLASVTTSFRVRLTGTQQENEAAIAKLLSDYGAALTTGYAQTLQPFVKSGETFSQALERLSTSLVGVNGVLDVLGQTAFQVSAQGGQYASELLASFGGLQQYQSAATAFMSEFFTEAERSALLTEQLRGQLSTVGVALPTSRDAYRDLVEAQDLTTESGRNTYAALLKLSPAFAQLVPATLELVDGSTAAADAVGLAASKMAEAGRRVLADLADEKGNLQVGLLRAEGNDDAATALARQQTLAKLTTGLTATDAAAATAAFDFNAALQQQIDVLNAAKTAAEEAAAAEVQRMAAVESQRLGLEGQLLQLQGDTAALRARELAALDPSNRALQERIFALQDEQTAAQAAAQIAQQAAAAAQAAAQAEQQRVAGIANQRSSIETQLLQLQGDTTALRARELAALDPSNRALQERIFALQDEQTAAQAAAQIAQQAAAAAQEAAQAEQQRVAGIASQRFSIETQLLQLQGDTTALRARELAALDPSNRALQERIFALQDEQTAAAAAAQAAQELASRQEAVAAQRDGIQARIEQLMGDTTALRARELAALDPSNRALQERIFALQDEQTAAAAAAQAAQELARQQEAVAAQRDGIQARIEQLMGDTTALRARELAALDPSNRALQERLFALQDAQTAQEAANRAAQEAAQAAEQQARAAEQLRDAWRSIGDTLVEEAQRILGLNTTRPQDTLAQAQARFGITTAQARAGDQEAAKLLPELSRTLLELVGNTVTSRADLERARAQVAASLQGTAGVLGRAFGFAAAPSNGTAVDLPGLLSQAAAMAPLTAAVPAQQQAATAAQDNLAALVVEVKELRLQVEALKAAANRSAAADERTRDLLIQVTDNGNAMQVEEA